MWSHSRSWWRKGTFEIITFLHTLFLVQNIYMCITIKVRKPEVQLSISLACWICILYNCWYTKLDVKRYIHLSSLSLHKNFSFLVGTLYTIFFFPFFYHLFTSPIHLYFHSMSALVMWELTCSTLVQYNVGSNPDRIKPNTINLVFAVSPLSTQY